MAKKPVKALSEGWALCTPENTLLPHSFRAGKADAIRSLFATDEAWSEAEQAGWTVEHVYARIFMPKFFVDVIPEERDAA
ncbi:MULTISPECIES: hypothetical protein [unclassified Ensifer]|uniref:hypothetical protein n=1 Tax=unclassified Ensifer TaxID=2633371 RepID=UPI000813391B|nr:MULTISPECIES: hypothetical protein [unclassified Ensifer]OCP17392.1 hypothetical protein BC361_08000 [Ensifer sp. LC54]OCP28702.1 hypothetical protein BC363_02355 [Ensifer sp. LC384]